jgi:hypothetical protein
VQRKVVHGKHRLFGRYHQFPIFVHFRVPSIGSRNGGQDGPDSYRRKSYISRTGRWILSLFDCPRRIFGLFCQQLHLGEGHLSRDLTPDGVAGERVQPIHKGCNQRIFGEDRSGISGIFGQAISKLLLAFINRLMSCVHPLVGGRNISFTGELLK